MVVEEFFAMVKQMRFAQIKYFSTRDKEDLLTAKSLEKMVDGCLLEWQEKRFRAQVEQHH
ncbi:hypothetical protein [Treponema pectinovorum]|uniref:hypothetical protein n=1 Tax=Treponema pectinovorum TaxID=164 RepID=UPI0011C7811D|nr:hypothetical protein [Treponema pectinovorum]